MENNKFKGTGVAIVTPFRKDGSIDFKSFEGIIEYNVKNNVNYIVVLGTTGESVTLSKDEKNAVVDFVIEIVDKRVPIVVGMGGNNTQEVVNCMADADFDNINAVLSVCPYYNKPSQRGIFLHYDTIANACPVPIIAYNVPGRTSSNMTAETTLKIANEIESIIGIKEASGNFAQCMKIIKERPKDFLVLSGDDALTLPLITIGVDGVISVVANAFPKDFSEMVQAALKGNNKKANELHYKLFDIMEALFIEGNPAGIKAALEIKGLCSNNLRLPLVKVSKPTYNLLSTLIENYNASN